MKDLTMWKMPGWNLVRGFSIRIRIDRIASIRFEFSSIFKKCRSERMIYTSCWAFQCFHFAVQDRKLKITNVTLQMYNHRRDITTKLPRHSDSLLNLQLELLCSWDFQVIESQQPAHQLQKSEYQTFFEIWIRWSGGRVTQAVAVAVECTHVINYIKLWQHQHINGLFLDHPEFRLAS